MLDENSGIDIIVPCAVYPPFLGMKFENMFRGIIRAWNVTGRKKPLIPLLVFGRGYPEIMRLARDANVPVFSTPQEAAYATRVLIDRMRFLKRNRII